MNQSTHTQNFSIEDFPLDAIVQMADEQWKVVKPLPTKDKVYLKPSNEVARSRYVSIAHEFSIPYLNREASAVVK